MSPCVFDSRMYLHTVCYLFAIIKPNKIFVIHFHVVFPEEKCGYGIHDPVDRLFRIKLLYTATSAQHEGTVIKTVEFMGYAACSPKALFGKPIAWLECYYSSRGSGRAIFGKIKFRGQVVSLYSIITQSCGNS